MSKWLQNLHMDPLPCLLSSDDKVLRYFVRRDLLGEELGSVEDLWEKPSALKIIKRQTIDGPWRYQGKGPKVYTFTNYHLLETYRNHRVLVEMYGFHSKHPALRASASYIFSCQTAEGDFRGILGNQYMPYYHGAMLELLIKSGYVDDFHIKKGMDWLLSVRQSDGGWVAPMQAIPAKQKTEKMWRGAPIMVDKSKPSSHLATGMVLRAFAAHPEYRCLEEVKAAGTYLKARFFQPEKYNDRKSPEYWTKFQYPFWWSNILTALDSLSMIVFSASDDEMRLGLDWFITKQETDGLWTTSYGKGRNAESARSWVGLAVSRVFKRLYVSGCA